MFISQLKVKNRTRRLTELFESYKPYDNRIGIRETVLVTEEATDKKHYVGHNKFYEQILIPKRKEYLGKIIEVEIVSTGKHYMFGKPLTWSISKLKLEKLLNIPKFGSFNLGNIWMTACCVILFSSLAIKLRSKF